MLMHISQLKPRRQEAIQERIWWFLNTPDTEWFSENHKTGPAWSITSKNSCPGATAACLAECYTNYGRQALDVVQTSKEIKLTWLLSWLKVNASQLANRMIKMIRKAKLKTLRIHDSGDFFSPIYTRMWRAVVKNTPDVEYWAYTRSHVIAPILVELKKLAALPNIALWLSADKDNYLATLAIYRANPEFAGISFMQTDDSEEIAYMLASVLPESEFVNFPIHKHFGRVVVDKIEVPNCPAITKEIKSTKELPACLACRKCLPQVA